jgi:hypothetical protein
MFPSVVVCCYWLHATFALRSRSRTAGVNIVFTCYGTGWVALTGLVALADQVEKTGGAVPNLLPRSVRSNEEDEADEANVCI